MEPKIERDENQQIITQKIDEVYLPRCAYYARFPAFFEKNTNLSYNTYHRSAAKKLKDVKRTEFSFMGNQIDKKNGMDAKTGNYFNTFYFDSYKTKVTPKEKLSSHTKKSSMYDALLKFQKSNAKFVVSEVKKSSNFSINQDHDYPCILFSLKQPAPFEKNPSIWTNFVSMYFIAICNKLSMEKGLNIEIVRRSSFDSIRPSVAECVESLRISLGLTPKAYHEIVIETIQYLDKLFSNSEVFNISADPHHKVKPILVKYNQLRQSNIELKDNLWKSLWANGDCKNHSFATQIFRREHVVELIIDDILTSMGENNLESIFLSADLKQTCFAKPILRYFESLCCENKVLTTKYKEKALTKFNWVIQKPLHDPDFWIFVKDFGKAIDANQSELQLLYDKKNLGELYHYFESWLIHFTFNPRKYQDTDDGYGSDSEIEETLTIQDKEQTIYAKKMITATGMRAIQLSYAVAKKFIEDIFNIDPVYVLPNAEKMYYETDIAIKNFPIPYNADIHKKTIAKQKVLNFFDLNHCNTKQLKEKKNLVKVNVSERICILDSTSATTDEIATNILRVWKQAPKMRVIILVSSGLKNEQAMSDYNPYGTIRIFARNKNDCDSVYANLIALEEQAGYNHPKISHMIRKNAKDEGFVPTNHMILNAKL